MIHTEELPLFPHQHDGRGTAPGDTPCLCSRGPGDTPFSDVAPSRCATWTGRMARRTDPATSRDAAARVRPKLSRLQELVYYAYCECGPMTAKQCETLPRFDGFGFSTIRKRTSELARVGLLRDTGERMEGCAVYEAAR